MLLRDRFLASVSWASGNPAEVSPLRTDESGILYFYNAENFEVVVKVLNGCNINGHYWVFTAGATSVGFTVTVEDTEAGEVWMSSDVNPVTDTSAFATCP